MIATLNTSKISISSSIHKQKEFGGFTFRIKQNLWGNDFGKTAFSILPFVSVPVTSGTKVSGGIVFPFALQLARGWDFGAQIETGISPNQNGHKYHSDFLASATTSFLLCKNVDFFVESVVTRNNETKTFKYYINGGPTYSLAKNVNLECGIYYGTGVYYGIKNISSKTFFIELSFRI